MKKVIFYLAITMIFISKSIFAVDFSLSAGGGGFLGYTFTRYTLEGGSVKSSQSMDRINYGSFLFFDATYVVFSFIAQGGYNSYSENMIYNEVEPLKESKGTGNETSIGLSLTGKYPLTINKNVSWYPIFGVEYHFAIIQRRQPDGDFIYDRTSGRDPADRDKNDNPYPLYAWNSLWINLGAGIDYNISGPLFLRSELMFGFRLPTIYELGALEVIKNPPMSVRNPSFAGLTGGPTFRLGIGYRFY